MEAVRPKEKAFRFFCISVSLPQPPSLPQPWRVSHNCPPLWGGLKRTFPKAPLGPRHLQGVGVQKQKIAKGLFSKLPCLLSVPSGNPSNLVSSFILQVNNGNQIPFKQFPSTEILNIRFNKMLDSKLPVASASVSSKLPQEEKEGIDTHTLDTNL